MAKKKIFVRSKKRKLSFEELSDAQRLDLKRTIVEYRAEARGDEVSSVELDNADELVSDEDLESWFGDYDVIGVDFGSSDNKQTPQTVVQTTNKEKKQ